MFQPFVSIVMPVRNEAKYIFSVLEAVFHQDYPTELLEVIIADGLSNDGTLAEIDRFKSAYPLFHVQQVENEKQIVPTGLNKAIKMSKGEVIVRLDAHSVYPTNYVSRLVFELNANNADNVGGVFITLPANDSFKSKAIAVAVSHPLGVGNSHHRIGLSKPQEVDTVPYGCFKRSVFEKVGYFDEELVRNQDDEFNGRLIKNGLKVFMIPDVSIYYHARDSFKKLYRMFFQYGLFKPLTVKKLKVLPTYRQLVPAAFVLFLFGGLILSFLGTPLLLAYVVGLVFYLTVILATALRKAKTEGGKIVPFLFASFVTIHMAYGLGYLKGLLAVLFNVKSPFKINNISR